MTIIYSNFGDRDCSDLPPIWQDLPDVKVVEVTPEFMHSEHENGMHWQEVVDKAIEAEKDFILFCGHGTPAGLLAPTWDNYILDKWNIDKVKATSIVGIWCNATSFALEHRVTGFFSSMFISNLSEARMCGVKNATSDQIAQNVRRFSLRVNKLIKDKVPVSEWQVYLGAMIDLEDEVESYNYQGLRSYLFS